MNRNKRFKPESRYSLFVIIIIILIIFGSFLYFIKAERSLSKVEQIFKSGIINSQHILYYPFRYLGNQYQEYKEQKRFYQKHKHNVDPALTKALKAENQDLKREINSLKQLLELETGGLNFDLVTAEVVNRNVGTWYDTLTINKGSKHGLTTNMIAVIKQNLIGKIINVSYTTSDLKLVTTTTLNNKIAVGIVTTTSDLTYGLIKDYNNKNKHLIVTDIIDDKEIEIGAPVITSGLTTNYPKGILVGKVATIKDDELGIAKILEVKSNIDFNNIRFVSIIKGERLND